MGCREYSARIARPPRELLNVLNIFSGEMYVILVALMVPAASGLLDCRQACRSCRENKEVPSIVEVYCSMCEECKERKREKFAATSTTLHGETILPDQVKYEEYPPPTTESFLFGPTTDNIIEKLREEFATAERYPPIGRFGDEDHRKDLRQRRRYRSRYRAHDDVEYESSFEDEPYHRLRPEGKLAQKDVLEIKFSDVLELQKYGEIN